jgi:hypothetical protein
MMKPKKCKGVPSTDYNGCGSLIERAFKFGLCKPCYVKWLFNTDKGKEHLNKIKLKVKTEKNKKVAAIYTKERRPAKKLEEMSMRELKIVTQKVCNAYIRQRDEINYGMCISSENKIDDAGHFFSIGSNEALRFSPQNIHGQNRRDNTYLSGNLREYEIGLKLRYGQPYVDDLYELHAQTMKAKVLTRDYVLKINKLYKYLSKKGIWVHTHLEFENYLNLMKL